MGQEYEARLSKTLLPRVTVADVQAVAKHCRVENSCLVKAIAHKKCVLRWLDLLDVARVAVTSGAHFL